MADLPQLQAERWWGREVVTAELDWLGDEMCRRTGRPRTAAGTKGDRHHLSGAHRSQEWLLHSAFATNRSYTVQTGLTATQLRHVAGFDFTPGDPEAMIAQSKRLMAAVRAGKLEAVREFYGNIDGDRIVDGWDNLRDRERTSDSSHLWHWHLTLDRRRCDDRALMERIVAVALGDPTEEDGMSWDQRLRDHRRGKDAPAGSLVAWTHFTSGETLDLVRQLVAGQRALLAAQQGEDVAAAVEALLEQAAVRERTERQAELGEVTEALDRAEQERAQIAALVGQVGSGGLTAEQVVDEIGRRLGPALPASGGD